MGKLDSSFMGLPTLQLWSDMELLEKVLNVNRFGTIIELGTYQGGLSLFLLSHALQMEAEFYTFDIDRWPGVTSPQAQAMKLDTYFTKGDIFGDSKEAVVRCLQEGKHPLLLYCDNGEKTREMLTFVPYLEPDDIVVVHDWGTEITEEAVAPLGRMLEPILVKECESQESITRFWRRVRTPSQDVPCVYGDWGKLAIGTRIHTHPEASFFMDWSALLTSGTRKGDSILMPRVGMPAHWASDALVRDFLRSGQDSLLVIDDDMSFPHDAVERLRSNEANWEYDIVFALCFSRKQPTHPVVLQRMSQPPPPYAFQGEFFYKHPPDGLPDNSVIEVDAVGMAFTLFRRQVFEAMVDQRYDLEWSYVFEQLDRQGLFREIVGKPDMNLELTGFFSYGEGKESDDIAFCRKAREMGFRMAVDTSVKIDHLMVVPVGWQQYQEQRAQEQAFDMDVHNLTAILKEAFPHVDDENKTRIADMLEALEGVEDGD